MRVSGQGKKNKRLMRWQQVKVDDYSELEVKCTFNYLAELMLSNLYPEFTEEIEAKP